MTVGREISRFEVKGGIVLRLVVCHTRRALPRQREMTMVVSAETTKYPASVRVASGHLFTHSLTTVLLSKSRSFFLIISRIFHFPYCFCYLSVVSDLSLLSVCFLT